jgi:signal transduction histidine kinase
MTTMLQVDMRTVIITNFLTSLTIVLIVILVWRSIRERFPGVTLWMASFGLQTFGTLLIMLRGIAPDWLSVIVGNLSVVTGMFLICLGVERFAALPGRAKWMWPALVIYTGLMIFFTFFRSNFAVRVVLTSGMIFLVSVRGSWMMLHTTPAELKPVTRGPGLVFISFALLQLCRIALTVIVPVPIDIFHAGPGDTYVLIINQILSVGLAFAIILMANNRFIKEAHRAESALKIQAQVLEDSSTQIKKYSENLEELMAIRTRELNDAQEKIIRQEKLVVLGQLAGGVGHELRNPLGIINNAVYFLRQIQPDPEEKVKEYLGIIETETHNAGKIISDLLEFSRNKSVDLEPVCVSELVKGVLKRFSAPDTITVSLELPENLPMIYVDPRQMTQVLGNLVVNASQAMAQGGILTLSAARKGDQLAIAVQDTGVGIPAENVDKLFQPLFTTKPKGIGLGLAVSRKLVEANGGRIEVRSEPGKGSTFTVLFPIQDLMHE